MRYAALLLALAVTSATPGQASAAAPDGHDWTCGFSTLTDPTTGDGAALVDGGPVRQNGRLTCTLQTDAPTHAGVPTSRVSVSADGVGVVTYLHPRVVPFPTPPLSEIYLCTVFTDAGGTTYYYDAVRDTWGTDADALCAWAVSPGAASATAAAPPAGLDNACAFTSVTDPTMRGRQLGELEGGPILQQGTLTCTIKVNAGTHSAVAADRVSASAEGIGGVTYLHPRVVTYRAAEDDDIWLCSEFTDADGTTYYLDGVDQTWRTDPGAACALAITG